MVEILISVLLLGIVIILIGLSRKLNDLRETQDAMRAVLSVVRIDVAYARHNSGRLMVHELGLRELDKVPEFLSPLDQSVQRIDDTPR